MRLSQGFRTWILFAAVLAVGGCSDSGPTQVNGEQVSLVECLPSESRSVTRTIGVLGGTIELDGHALTLPPGAVLLPTEFVMTVPASSVVEVHVTANGNHGFGFLVPAGFSISYDRCAAGDVDTDDLAVYKIDPSTKALLKRMDGSLNLLERLLAFTTDSLSAYSIAQ